MSHPNLSQITDGARGERGAALVMSMLIVALVAVISIGVLGVVRNEARVAGADLRHTGTFYAASAGLVQVALDPSAGVLWEQEGPHATGYLQRMGQWLRESF